MTLGLRKDFLGNKKSAKCTKILYGKNHQKKGGVVYILEKDICNPIADRELVPGYIYRSSHDLIKVNEINI